MNGKKARYTEGLKMLPLRLAYHSPAEWATEMAMRARDLGCSEDYCARLAAQILERSKIPLTALHTR